MTAKARGNPVLGDNSRFFLLPSYNLKPVTAIEFSTFVLTLIMCNPSHSFDYATIIELWCLTPGCWSG